MICRNCQQEVDNDLVFCTECGSRLHETISNAQTVIMPESIVTKVTDSSQKPKSSFKWLAIVSGLIILIAIPAALITAYFVFNKPNKPTANKTNNNSSTQTNKKPVNQNKTPNPAANNNSAANNWNINSNSTNNSPIENSNSSLKASETKILDERININENSHIAFPFEVREEMVKIVGEVELLEGENYEGYVFLQEIYDENQVEPDTKMFSFDSNQGKTANTEQFLPKGNYVLVFANNDGNGALIKANFRLIPQATNWK